METSDTREAIIRRYIDAYNRFDIDGMLRDLHPDIVFENVSGGEINTVLRGVDEFRQQALQAAGLFASRQQQVVHLAERDDTVEVAIHYKGVLAADLPRGLKKGDTIELQGRSLFRFQGHQIIAITDIS